MTRKQLKTRKANRRTKADMKRVTTRRLPTYARDMMMLLHRYGNRVYMHEWSELYVSFDGPKRESKAIFHRLKRVWRRRAPIGA